MTTRALPPRSAAPVAADCHDAIARAMDTQAEAARSYLDWSEDPAQRVWASDLADCYDRLAKAERRYAESLRSAA